MYCCTVLVASRAYHPVVQEASDRCLNADGRKMVLHQPLALWAVFQAAVHLAVRRVLGRALLWPLH